MPEGESACRTSNVFSLLKCLAFHRVIFFIFLSVGMALWWHLGEILFVCCGWHAWFRCSLFLLGWSDDGLGCPRANTHFLTLQRSSLLSFFIGLNDYSILLNGQLRRMCSYHAELPLILTRLNDSRRCVIPERHYLQELWTSIFQSLAGAIMVCPVC